MNIQRVGFKYLRVLAASVWCFGHSAAVVIAKTEKSKAPEPKPTEVKEETSFICPEKKAALLDLPRADTYKTTPYKPGEVAEYEVRYMGALAGTASIEVRPPYKFQFPNKKGYWHRNFHVDARTGDWYKLIFVAHDQIDAIVRPWDYGISKFYMDQDEGKFFGRRLQQKKWLEFDHEGCKVSERTAKVGKKEKRESFDLSYGAMDTLGVAFWLREQVFKVGEKKRALIYSSEKNWWLEVEAIGVEKIKTKAGEFEAMKMKLQTYIGKDLQQKGDVLVWIDTKTTPRPLVLIQADIKIGSVWIEISKFTEGK